MGGVSQSSFHVSEKNVGMWSGEVKIVPKLSAPGFCTVHSGTDKFPDLSEHDGLLITARQTLGEAGLTKVKISMESSARSSPRQGEFEGVFHFPKSTSGTTRPGQFYVPFASMTQSWRGQKEGGAPSKQQLASITRIGFNEDGVAGKFQFEIHSIQAYSGQPGPAPGPAPAPSPSPHKAVTLASFADGKAEGAEWQAVNDPVMGGASVSNTHVRGDALEWRGDVKIVQKLHAPGFCRLQGEIAKKDLSSFDGLLFSLEGQGAPLQTMVAVIESRGLLGGGQWTAPLTIHQDEKKEGHFAFAAWEAFKPFGIRPEPGPKPSAQQLKHIVQVGLLLDGTAGQFEIELSKVQAIGRPGPGPAPAPSPAPMPGKTLFEFGSADSKAWRITNDPVMGGRSKSTFSVGDDGAGNHNIGLFSGDVAIVPSLKAPGFCDAEVMIPAVDASEYDAIEITLRSHGELTAFKSSWGGKGVPKDPNCHHPGCQYQTGSFKASFNVTQQSATAAPQKIVIPFTEYTYEWSDFTGGCTDHGAKCCDPEETPNTCPSKTALASISQVGIWGEGTAGTFALDIFSVRAVKMDSLPDAQLAENTASGDEHHLYFHWVNPHPTGFGAPKTGPWCGDIDAARLVPDALFKSPLQLWLYKQATISLYSIPGGPQAGDLKVGRCQDNGFTLRRSLITGAQWTPADLQGPVCEHLCDCQWPGYAPAAGLSVCQNAPDDPAKGEFCSLCGPNAPGNCGGQGGACTQGINLWLPTPTGE